MIAPRLGGFIAAWWRMGAEGRSKEQPRKHGLQALAMWSCANKRPYEKMGVQAWSRPEVTLVRANGTPPYVDPWDLVPSQEWWHLSYFEALGMREHLPAWYAFLQERPSRESIVQLLGESFNIRRWSHVPDEAFWKHACGFVDAFFPMEWTTILEEAAIVGNVHVFMAADEGRCSAFAQEQAVEATRIRQEAIPFNLGTMALSPLGWRNVHVDVALHYVAREWISTECLSNMVMCQSTNCATEALYAAPTYTAYWGAKVLQSMPWSSEQKALFVHDWLDWRDSSDWDKWMHDACMPYLGDVELDIVFALANEPLPQELVLGMSHALDTALRHSDVRSYDGSGSSYPALTLAMEQAPPNSFQTMYALGVQLKRMERGADAQEYELPAGL